MALSDDDWQRALNINLLIRSSTEDFYPA